MRILLLHELMLNSKGEKVHKKGLYESNTTIHRNKIHQNLEWKDILQ